MAGRGTPGKQFGRPFVKGQSGNPLGPCIDQTVRKFRETSLKDFVTSLQKFGSMSPKDIKAEIHDETDMPAFQVMFGRLVYQASQGDKQAYQLITERLWGKVKDSVEISSREMDDRIKQVGNDKLTAIMREIEVESNKIIEV